MAEGEGCGEVCAVERNHDTPAGSSESGRFWSLEIGLRRPPIRQGNGWRKGEIPVAEYREPERSRDLFEADDLKKAESLIASSGSHEAMNKAGVIGKPDILFLS